MNKINDRRELTDEEAIVVNIVKTLERTIFEYTTDVLKQEGNFDQECINEGLVNIRQGFMWIVRGITKQSVRGN